MPLNKKQKTFCAMYFNGCKAEHAVQKAGIEGDIQKIAAELLIDPKINDYLEELYKQFKSISKKQIETHLSNMVCSTATDAIKIALSDSENYSMTNLDKLDLCCISEIKKGKESIEFKLYDKTKILDSLIKIQQTSGDFESIYDALNSSVTQNEMT